ncbi:MAG: phosphatidate cytidylyltransferase [Burkholderiaceae bacterium]
MLRIRIATAIVLLAILLPAIFLGSPQVWAIVSLVFVVLAIGEWTRLLGQRRMIAVAGALMAVAGGAFIAWRYGGPHPAPSLSLACIVLTAFWVAGGAARLIAGNARGGGWPLAFVLLFGAWLALVELREIGVWALLSSMAIVWIADVAAYFAGRAFGRRKLAPSISPGKSWEGAIGGALCVAAYGVVVALAAPAQAHTLPSVLAAWSWPGMLVVLIGLAALSVVGDLHESLLKRQAGAKDSSQLLPGHGGVLDRIDALIPVMPATLMLYQLLGA